MEKAFHEHKWFSALIGSIVVGVASYMQLDPVTIAALASFWGLRIHAQGKVDEKNSGFTE